MLKHILKRDILEADPMKAVQFEPNLKQIQKNRTKRRGKLVEGRKEIKYNENK